MRPFLATAAIGGLLTGPAAAVTVALDDDFKVTRVVTITADTDVSTPIFIVGQVSDVVVVEDSPLLGETVVTADNQEFGTVVQVQEYPDGTTRAIVDIAAGAGIEAEAAYFDLSEDVLGENYDGSIQLNLPASQLQQTLNNREETDTSSNLTIPSTTGGTGEAASADGEAEVGDQTEADGETSTDTDTDAGTDMTTDADTGPATDADADTGTGADTGTDTDAGAATGTDADAGDAGATDDGDGTGSDGSDTDGSDDGDTGADDSGADGDSGDDGDSGGADDSGGSEDSDG